MNARTVVPLLRPTAHAVRWRPLAAGAVLGTTVLLLPEALTTRLTVVHLTDLARLTAICLALGAAFVLDDPAARSTPAVPTPRLARNLVRVALTGPVIALWWALTIGLAKTTGHHEPAADLPVGGLTLEAATLVAAAFALAAGAQRRNDEGTGGVVAAPAVLLFVAVTRLLPGRANLVLDAGDPRWATVHRWWAGLLAVAAVAFVWAGHEPARRGDRAGR